MLQFKTFDQLTTQECYAILKLRVDVFVVEQQCAYPEIDGVDIQAMHIFLKEGEDIVAYARTYIHEDAFQIGRVVVAKEARGRGLAQQVVAAAVQYGSLEHPRRKQRLQAQVYLQDFYASFGFQATSEPYEEDGIPHIDMEKTKD